MKRLCIFYKFANHWFFTGKKVEWIICKECQRKLKNRKLLTTRIAHSAQ